MVPDWAFPMKSIKRQSASSRSILAWLTICFAVLSCLTLRPGHAQDDKNKEARADEVEAFLRHYFKSWSDQDMKAYQECFLPNATIQYIDERGNIYTKPRDKFVTSQVEYHRKSPDRAVEAPVSMSVKFQHGLSRAVVYWKLNAGKREALGYDHFTLVKVNGSWRIANLVFYSTSDQVKP